MGLDQSRGLETQNGGHLPLQDFLLNAQICPGMESVAFPLHNPVLGSFLSVHLGQETRALPTQARGFSGPFLPSIPMAL